MDTLQEEFKANIEECNDMIDKKVFKLRKVLASVKYAQHRVPSLNQAWKYRRSIMMWAHYKSALKRAVIKNYVEVNTNRVGRLFKYKNNMRYVQKGQHIPMAGTPLNMTNNSVLC